jgi:hypothetical protein
MVIGMNLDEVTISSTLQLGFFCGYFFKPQSTRRFHKGRKVTFDFRIKLIDLEGFEYRIFLNHYDSGGFNPRWLSG